MDAEFDARPGFDAHLRAGDVTVDANDVALLAAIDREGSLSAAADSLGRSYSRAQKRITELERELGALVERTRGGATGGGSRLTSDGHDLLARFARVRAAFADTAETETAVLRGPICERDGELVAVDTAIGLVRALLFEDAERVQVGVRADAVTLHDSADAPAADASSARNRFPGTISSVDEREAVALVHVEVPAAGSEEDVDGASDDERKAAVDEGAASLPVLVTLASVDRLGLEPGREVVATFKATATRATPV